VVWKRGLYLKCRFRLLEGSCTARTSVPGQHARGDSDRFPVMPADLALAWDQADGGKCDSEDKAIADTACDRDGTRETARQWRPPSIAQLVVARGLPVARTDGRAALATSRKNRALPGVSTIILPSRQSPITSILTARFESSSIFLANFSKLDLQGQPPTAINQRRPVPAAGGKGRKFVSPGKYPRA
jgi:hypothetical protein